VKLDERSIYPNLKLTIYKTGIRQNRLAKMVGIHEAYLSRIVNGSREPGDALRQAKIARLLNSDVPEPFAVFGLLLCGCSVLIVVCGKAA
jgi:transcriptional regulator with XRE-family HTH domain